MILDTPPLIDADDDALRVPSCRQISTSGESIMLRILECECYGRNPLRFSLKIIYEELALRTYALPQGSQGIIVRVI